jgi:Lar family restriction alleviation protein
MTHTPELLPCPHCGGKARVVTYKRRIGPVCPHIVFRQHVTCGKCGAQTKIFKRSGKPVAAWNRRIPTAAQAEIARLTAEQQKLAGRILAHEDDLSATSAGLGLSATLRHYARADIYADAEECNEAIDHAIDTMEAAADTVEALLAALAEIAAAYAMEEDTPEHNHEDRLDAAIKAGVAAIAKAKGD